MNLDALTTFMAEARHCAEEMWSNADYIQTELPNLSLDSSLKEATIIVCNKLIGTKFDIVTELFELNEVIGSFSSDEVINRRVKLILRWLQEDICQMHDLVMAAQSAADVNSVNTSASVLITESALNILNAFNRTKEASGFIGP